jgi:hypothetical protein
MFCRVLYLAKKSSKPGSPEKQYLSGCGTAFVWVDIVSTIERIFNRGTGMPGGSTWKYPEAPPFKTFLRCGNNLEGERLTDTHQELPLLSTIP